MPGGKSRSMPCVGGRDGEGGREIYKRTNKCEGEAKLLQPLHRPVRNVREEGKKTGGRERI